VPASPAALLEAPQPPAAAALPQTPLPPVKVVPDETLCSAEPLLEAAELVSADVTPQPDSGSLCPAAPAGTVPSQEASAPLDVDAEVTATPPPAHTLPPSRSAKRALDSSGAGPSGRSRGRGQRSSPAVAAAESAPALIASVNMTQQEPGEESAEAPAAAAPARVADAEVNASDGTLNTTHLDDEPAFQAQAGEAAGGASGGALPTKLPWHVAPDGEVVVRADLATIRRAALVAATTPQRSEPSLLSGGAARGEESSAETLAAKRQRLFQAASLQV